MRCDSPSTAVSALTPGSMRAARRPAVCPWRVWASAAAGCICATRWMARCCRPPPTRARRCARRQRCPRPWSVATGQAWHEALGRGFAAGPRAAAAGQRAGCVRDGAGVRRLADGHWCDGAALPCGSRQVPCPAQSVSGLCAGPAGCAGPLHPARGGAPVHWWRQRAPPCQGGRQAAVGFARRPEPQPRAGAGPVGPLVAQRRQAGGRCRAGRCRCLAATLVARGGGRAGRAALHQPPAGTRATGARAPGHRTRGSAMGARW